MVELLLGPAAGVTLQLRRAPVILRVVKSRTGQWDALDQPDDVAKPTEQIVLYRLARKPTYLHVRASKKTMSGCWAMAQYVYLVDQPIDADVRTNEAWRRWCDLNQARLLDGLSLEVD